MRSGRLVRSLLFRAESLKTYRIADADCVGGSGRRQTEAAMKVELLLMPQLVSSAKIKQMLRTTCLRIGASVFKIGVQKGRKLPVEVDACLSGHDTPTCCGWHVKAELACCGPIFGQRSRPGHLEARIVAMARPRVGSGWQAEAGDEGKIKAVHWAELLLQAHDHIAGSARQAKGHGVGAKVIRQRKRSSVLCRRPYRIEVSGTSAPA